MCVDGFATVRQVTRRYTLGRSDGGGRKIKILEHAAPFCGIRPEGDVVRLGAPDQDQQEQYTANND